MEDSYLIKYIKENDKKAFRKLHDKYYPQMYLYASKSIHADYSLAAELVNDCFIKFWENRKKIEISKSVKHYLYLMLRNCIMDHFRERRLSTESLKQDFPMPGDEKFFDDQLEYVRLHQAIKRLPDGCREVLELAVFEFLTYSEIADKLQVSKNTVKTQMGRAYKRLREMLDPKDFHFFMVLRKMKYEV